VVILHTFLALAAGLAVVVLLGIALSALVARLVPSWTDAEVKLQPGTPAGGLCPPGRKPGFAFVSLGSSFLAAAAGGYVTAWFATGNPLIQVLVLGLVVLALAALSALQLRGQHPIWFQLVQVALSPIGVLAGGLARLRVMGIL
jgi:hypothetical protein